MMALLSAAFVRIGVDMHQQGDVWGAAVIVFFGFCLVICVAMLFPGTVQLVLNREGFEVRTFMRSSMTAWKDVRYFKAERIGTQSVVSFDLNDAVHHRKLERTFSKLVSGSQCKLPNIYNVRTDTLVSTLEEWRVRYSA